MHNISCSYKIRRQKTYTVRSKGLGHKSGSNTKQPEIVYMTAISGQQQQQSNINAETGKKLREGNGDHENEMTERGGEIDTIRETGAVVVTESQYEF